MFFIDCVIMNCLMFLLLQQIIIISIINILNSINFSIFWLICIRLFWNLWVFFCFILFGGIMLFFWFLDIEFLIIFFCLGGFLINMDKIDVMMRILIGCMMIMFWKKDIIIEISYLLEVFVFYIRLQNIMNVVEVNVVMVYINQVMNKNQCGKYFLGFVFLFFVLCGFIFLKIEMIKMLIGMVMILFWILILICVKIQFL